MGKKEVAYNTNPSNLSECSNNFLMCLHRWVIRKNLESLCRWANPMCLIILRGVSSPTLSINPASMFLYFLDANKKCWWYSNIQTFWKTSKSWAIENLSNQSNKLLGKEHGLTKLIHQILVSALIFLKCFFRKKRRVIRKTSNSVSHELNAVHLTLFQGESYPAFQPEVVECFLIFVILITSKYYH